MQQNNYCDLEIKNRCRLGISVNMISKNATRYYGCMSTGRSPIRRFRFAAGMCGFAVLRHGGSALFTSKKEDWMSCYIIRLLGITIGHFLWCPSSLGQKKVF